MQSDIVQQLNYIAAVLEANKNKFTVPGHIPAKIKTVREAAAEITRLTEALRAAEERVKALREVLSQLSSYVGAGIGDEGTTSEQFIKRITWGIDHISDAQLAFAAAIVEECSKRPQTTWGEVKQAILARAALKEQPHADA